MRTAIPLTVLVTGLACSLFTAPAQARARVFVASYGNDGNPCTFGSPCKTFQQAVNVVDVGGEVTAIDSAGFGPINITKSVTITSPAGVEAGIAAPAANAAAITINTQASGSIITLNGLTLDGALVAGSTGISFTGQMGNLNVRDCVIRNFGQDGIDFHPDGGGVLSVSNTVVSDNGNTGIAYYPSGFISSFAFGLVTLNRVEMRNNSKYGFFLWGAQSTTPSNNTIFGITASVFESTASGGQYGFYALTDHSHAGVLIQLFHSVATGASNAGLRAEGGENMFGGLGVITAANSMVVGNATAYEKLSGGDVESFGDNYLTGNFSQFTTVSPPLIPQQ
jgi:hypothetical protein